MLRDQALCMEDVPENPWVALFIEALQMGARALEETHNADIELLKNKKED